MDPSELTPKQEIQHEILYCLDMIKYHSDQAEIYKERKAVLLELEQEESLKEAQMCEILNPGDITDQPY
jgi:hypothetical protein|tara:strand:+ start:1154 stop:1360 length:207 start_codon:yes stop_codon:yes gene_type:complete